MSNSDIEAGEKSPEAEKTEPCCQEKAGHTRGECDGSGPHGPHHHGEGKCCGGKDKSEHAPGECDGSGPHGPHHHGKGRCCGGHHH
jgi:hypothetical protein